VHMTRYLDLAELAASLLDKLGPRFAGPIAILRNWTFCLFYVMAELWGSVVVSLLFWGFANQVQTWADPRLCESPPATDVNRLACSLA